MGNNARMSEQVKDKVLALMKLALEYNRNDTEQKLLEELLLDEYKGTELEELLLDEQILELEDLIR